MCNILNVMSNNISLQLCQLFSPSEYLILPTYLYILTVNLLVYFYHSVVPYCFIVLHCYGTRISFGINKVLFYSIVFYYQLSDFS